MTVRSLTIKEMLAQEDGAAAVLLQPHGQDYPIGTPVVRRKAYRDDNDSVAYYFDGSQFSFFEEGEIGVVEVVDHRHVGGIEGEITTGVFQPELDKRKNGKILVHLFDQGFPNAVFEISKVMTWAGDVKGYKPHDWKRLPDAENALEGAASRHRMEHNKERQGGAKLIDIIDHESKLLHKAHEAFNVLAELEMILTQRIS